MACSSHSARDWSHYSCTAGTAFHYASAQVGLLECPVNTCTACVSCWPAWLWKPNMPLLTSAKLRAKITIPVLKYTIRNKSSRSSRLAKGKELSPLISKKKLTWLIRKYLGFLFVTVRKEAQVFTDTHSCSDHQVLTCLLSKSMLAMNPYTLPRYQSQYHIALVLKTKKIKTKKIFRERTLHMGHYKRTTVRKKYGRHFCLSWLQLFLEGPSGPVRSAGAGGRIVPKKPSVAIPLHQLGRATVVLASNWKTDQATTLET